jgi:hypothetical protein
MHTSMRFALGPTHPVLRLVLALAVAVTGCSPIEPITAPASSFGSLDPTTYVAAGTSLSAGYQSGGLVDRHQVRAFPAIFARLLGQTVQLDGRGTFTQPVYDRDGFPQLLHIVSYSPLVISGTGRTTGNPINLSQAGAYHDLAVPFAIAFDFVDSTYYYDPSFPPPSPPPARFTYFNNIVRHRGTIAQQVLSLAPTLLTWEYGVNEVLGPAVNGVAASATTAEQYLPVLNASLDAIHAALPGAEIAIFNVPAPTTIPFAHTLSPFTVDLANGQPLPLLGVDGALQVGDLVLLSAAGTIATTGTGIPVNGYNYLNPSVPGNDQPLAESYILRSAEIAQTQVEIGEMNAGIAAQVAARSYVALVDLHALYQDLGTNGLALGGTRYTTEFVTGGLFSLDGVHPNDLAHAVIANALVDAVNARFGAAIRHANPLDWATASSSAAKPAFPEGRAYPRIEGLMERLPRPIPPYVQLPRSALAHP